jgi:hypothetical protein
VSYQATTWAVTQRAGSPGHKAVLMSLANRAGVESWACLASQKDLAAETEQSERTVRRQLVDLETAGLIQRHARYRGGHRAWDHYQLCPQANRSDRPVSDFIPDNCDVHTGHGWPRDRGLEQVLVTSTDVLTRGEAPSADFEVNHRQPPWLVAGMTRDAWLRMQREGTETGAGSLRSREEAPSAVGVQTGP